MATVLPFDGVGGGGEPLEAAVLRRTRRAYLLFGALLLAFLLLATVLKIGGAVIASGEVSVENSVKTITHPTGGVITRLLVHEGDRVRAGQPLMEFDTSVSRVGSESASASLLQLLARRARLLAERDGAAAVAFPPELTGSRDPQAHDLMARETQAFTLRRTERAGSLALLDQRVAQHRSEIASFLAQIAAVDQQRALIQPELDGLRRLYAQKLVTINQMNVMERTAVQLDGSKAALSASIAQSRGAIAEVDEQKLNVDKTIRSDASQQLAEVVAQIGDQQVRSASASDAFARSVVRAPQSGTIDKMAFTTVGSAVPADQPILQIVPDTEQLIVEARVRPQDVDQLATGQAARVVFSGFNRQTTPDIPGRLSFVSPELAQDPHSGASYYRIRIRLDEKAVRAVPQMQLKAGMPAETYVQTGSRSILSYLLQPLHDQLRHALRED